MASRTVKDKITQVVAEANTLIKLIKQGKDGQKEIVELERELALCLKEFESAIKGWKDDRKKTVELLRELANQIQTHENNSRIAKLFGASSSIVGLSLGIAGTVGAMFTFGGSLILTAVGTGIAAAGGITVVGTNVVNGLLCNTNVKVVEDAVKKDGDGSREIQDLFEKVQKVLKRLKMLKKSVPFECGRMHYKVAFAVSDGVHIGMQFGETALETLGEVSVFTVAGITFSAISIALNIYTLVSTSYNVHKGSVLKVVEDIREVAQKLEDKMNVFGDVNHENQRDIFAE